MKFIFGFGYKNFYEIVDNKIPVCKNFELKK